jgi:flagellar biogenesis protein FliO
MEVAAALRAFAALIVIALVLLGLHFALRSFGRRAGAPGRLLRIVETIFLPGASSLHLIAVGDRYYVIGRGNAQLTLLAEIPAVEAGARLGRDA